MADKDATPEGRLIADALTRVWPKLSTRKAAALAGMTDTRWRQIVTGELRGGKPTVGPADTVARMARVVELDPDDLENAGRADVAEEMRRLEEANPIAPVGEPPPGWDRLSDRQRSVIAAVVDAILEGHGASNVKPLTSRPQQRQTHDVTELDRQDLPVRYVARRRKDATPGDSSDP